MKTMQATEKLPTFKSLFVPAQPEPRRRYPRNTFNTAVTTKLPVLS